jgi:hypothetical protein
MTDLKGGSGIRLQSGLLVSLSAIALTVYALCLSPIAVAAATTRTYELVDPEHQGFPTGVGPMGGPPNQGVWVDPAGGAIAYGSPDAFVGGSGTGVTFFSTRGSAGWRTIGLYPDLPSSSVLNPVNTVGISDDYSRLIIQTASPLLPADTNGAPDVYLWDRGTGALTWVSESSGANASYYEGRSSDASHIVFVTSNNLVPEATGDALKVYEWAGGSVRLVSVKPDGSLDSGGAGLGGRDESGGDSSAPLNAVARDGSRIVFSSPLASTSTTADPTELYVRIDGTHTDEVSASLCTRSDCNSPAAASYAGATANGGFVFFLTAQQLVNDDHDDRIDLYRYDVTTKDLKALSLGVGAALPGSSRGLAILGASSDGERVYFRSADSGLVLWDHGQLVPIATTVDSLTMSATLNCQQPDLAGVPNVSPDGGTLAFSTQRLVRSTGDPSESGLFLYRAATGQLVHIASDGTLPSSPFFDYSECYRSRGLVGNRPDVVFSTTLPLVPQDVNGHSDVYEWDDGTITLISDGLAQQDAMLLGISSDGRDIYFTTLSQLSPLDRDGLQDIYDARATAPTTVPVHTDCGEDDCQDTLAAADLRLAGGGSATLHSSHRRRQVSIDVVRTSAHHATIRLLVRVSTAGSLRAKASTRLGHRVRVVGRARQRVSAGRSSISIHLSAQARRLLTHEGHMKVLVKVTFLGMTRRVAVTLHG